MTQIGPDDEFYEIRGGRPEGGHIDDFKSWDPTNYYGFREDDPQFPAPPPEEAVRRRTQAADEITGLLNEYVNETEGDW